MSLQSNILLQWMLEKGMRFYEQMLVPFFPHPYKSRVEMDKEDTTQNIEHREAVGAQHQQFFSGHIPCTTFDFLNWKLSVGS